MWGIRGAPALPIRSGPLPSWRQACLLNFDDLRLDAWLRAHPFAPEHRAHNASFELSPAEADVYKAVTTGVRDEMNCAYRTGDDKRRSSVGFAFQVLQRQSVPLTRWAEECRCEVPSSALVARRCPA